MDAAISDILKDVLARHGTALLDNPRVGPEIVRENLGKSRKLEAGLLNTVMLNGAPNRLLSISAASLTTTLVANYAASISKDTGLKEDLARWAIETWIDGLGLKVISADDPSLNPVLQKKEMARETTTRACPFCGAAAATQLCKSCGRDTTASRRPCPACKKMVPSSETVCWNCRAVLHSDLRWKIPVIILLFVLAFIVGIGISLIK
jgi:predicted nucleic acid-binding Zn ribbon protein